MQAPINKLSDDILRMVFNLCCENVPHGDAVARAKDLTQVCTRWCVVAKDNVAIWSRFDLTDATDEEARTFFRLSRGHKKRIMYRNLEVRNSIVQLLNQHMDSVAELDLTAKDEASCVSWIKDRIPSAPVLRAFSLRLADYASTYQQRLIPDFPEFTGKTPSLRHLTLEGLRAPWRKECYRNLTTLRLSKCALDPHSLDEDIFVVLERSPGLQELQLDMFCLVGWHPKTDRLMNQEKIGGRKLALKALRILRLSLPHPYLFYVLRGLDISQHLRLLHLDVVDYDNHDYTAALLRMFHPKVMHCDIPAGARSVLLEQQEYPSRLETLEFSGAHPEGLWRRRISWRGAAGQTCVQVLNTLMEHHYQALVLVESFEFVSRKNARSTMSFDVPQNLPTLVARLTNLVSLKLSATNHHQLIPRISRFRFAHLTSFSVTTPFLEPLPAIRIGWLPSLHGNCPELKHFDVTLDPQDAQETLGGPFLKGADEVDVKLAREELEAIARAHTNISVRGYVYVRKGEDGLGEPQLTQIWPMAEKELA